MAQPPSRRRWKRAGALQWLHTLGLVAYVGLFKYGADRWGWATVLAYAPRWPALGPSVVILLGALLCRRRPWLTIAVTALSGVWLLDAHAPWPRFGGDASVRLRVMTLNADGGNTAGRGTDMGRIGRFIAGAKPDVIFLQEWRMPTPPPLPGGTGWNVRRERGEMIATRLPVDRVATLPSDKLLGQSSLLACRATLPTGRQVWLVTPHLETPRRAFDAVLDREPEAMEITAESATRRQSVSEQAVAWVRDLAGDDDVLIGGDFNLVGDGRIFQSTWASAFTDAFARAGWGTGGTKLQHGWRVRIDHILTGRAWRATHSVPGPDVGSDHLPLIADVDRR